MTVLPDFKISNRVNEKFDFSGIDSYAKCRDQKHFKNYPYQVSYSYNSRGFRDAEWPDNSAELKSAIWCLGDSFTVGLGSPIQHTWPYLLGQKLSKRTINVSLDGASNSWIARKALRVLEEIQPEIMVIHWSYLHREEINDESLRDEERQLFTLIDKYMSNPKSKYLNELRARIDNIESIKNTTKVIYSAVPESGIDFDVGVLWRTLAGKDWESCPRTLDEFYTLSQSTKQELLDFGQYTELLAHFQLLHGVNFVPEFPVLDLARDGHHYDLHTAEHFVSSVCELLGH